MKTLLLVIVAFLSQCLCVHSQEQGTPADGWIVVEPGKAFKPVETWMRQHNPDADAMTKQVWNGDPVLTWEFKRDQLRLTIVVDEKEDVIKSFRASLAGTDTGDIDGVRLNNDGSHSLQIRPHEGIMKMAPFENDGIPLFWSSVFYGNTLDEAIGQTKKFNGKVEFNDQFDEIKLLISREETPNAEKEMLSAAVRLTEMKTELKVLVERWNKSGIKPELFWLSLNGDLAKVGDIDGKPGYEILNAKIVEARSVSEKLASEKRHDVYFHFEANNDNSDSFFLPPSSPFELPDLKNQDPAQAIAEPGRAYAPVAQWMKESGAASGREVDMGDSTAMHWSIPGVSRESGASFQFVVNKEDQTIEAVYFSSGFHWPRLSGMSFFPRGNFELNYPVLAGDQMAEKEIGPPMRSQKQAIVSEQLLMANVGRRIRFTGILIPSDTGEEARLQLTGIDGEPIEIDLKPGLPEDFQAFCIAWEMDRIKLDRIAVSLKGTLNKSESGPDSDSLAFNMTDVEYFSIDMISEKREDKNCSVISSFHSHPDKFWVDE